MDAFLLPRVQRTPPTVYFQRDGDEPFSRVPDKLRNSGNRSIRQTPALGELIVGNLRENLKISPAFAGNDRSVLTG
jgi:hypothetical protein